jgi:hypothetical protein
MHTTLFFSVTALVFGPLASRATFTFSITQPIQCGPLNVSWTGGTGPYNLLLVPFGILNPEIRIIVDTNYTADITSDSFPMTYPAQSQFLAMMSDATGVGSGGTSIITTVAASDDKSCLSTTPTSPKFFLYLTPSNLTQCASEQVGWSTDAVGQVSVYGLIPGGQSFQLPIPATGTSYTWNTDVRAGSSVMLVAGDSQGRGTGGSSDLLTVQNGDAGCINSLSPSSTLGSPAGSVTGSPLPNPGGYVTSDNVLFHDLNILAHSSNNSGGGSGSKVDIGAIVGGVVGGVVGLAALGLVILFFYRRSQFHKSKLARKNRVDVDLIPGEGRPSGEYYQPEPFLVPDSTTAQMSSRRSGSSFTDHVMSALDRSSSRPTTPGFNHTSSGSHFPPSSYVGIRDNRNSSQYSLNRPESSVSVSEHSPTSNSSSNSTGKGRALAPLRAVNIIQHNDAGTLEPTIAPPEYASVHASPPPPPNAD